MKKTTIKFLSVLLSLIMVFSLFATETAAAASSKADAEIKSAIKLGLVPKKLQKNYNSSITYGEFCSIIDSFISRTYPKKLSKWKKTSKKYRNSKTKMSRMEGVLVFFYAAMDCDLDDKGSRYQVPLYTVMNKKLNFYEGVTFRYPLLPDYQKKYYNNDFTILDNAVFFAETRSYKSAKAFFDYDKTYRLNLEKKFTRGDAIRAVQRLYETAVFFRYEPSCGLKCTVSKKAIKQGNAMPEATWQKLPDWKGYTVPIRLESMDYNTGMYYEKEEIDTLAKLGFNFVRVPLDFSFIFKGEITKMANPEFLETMDRLVEYCAANNVHVCFDLHNLPGFTTPAEPKKDDLFVNQKRQRLFVEFWSFMAKRYQNVPSNLLSFNLLNEPHSLNDTFPTDQEYSNLMLRAIDAIRKESPDRLIFTDYIGLTWGYIAEGLANAKVVHSVHCYFAQSGLIQWPEYAINGFISNQNGTLKLRGNFPAGTKITVTIPSIQLDSTLTMTGDKKEFGSIRLGYEKVGQNGCTAIYEKGGGGEWREYNPAREWTVTLKESCREIEISQENGVWYNIAGLYVSTGTYETGVTADHFAVTSEAVPTLSFQSDGRITADKPECVIERSKEWIKEQFKRYTDYAQRTGNLIMVQEFGFSTDNTYQATLHVSEDFLSVLDELKIPWCSWCGELGPVMDIRQYEWNEKSPLAFSYVKVKWDGATYRKISKHWYVADEFMNVFKKYM